MPWRHCALILSLFLAVMTWSIMAEAFCSTVTVTGAGSLEVNGAYEYVYITHGKPSYDYDTFALFWTGGYWIIQDWRGTGAAYYYNLADTPTPPETGWLVHTLGSAELPAPTLSSSACSSPTIVAEATLGGSIDPSGTVTVVEGGNQTFVITPDTGYMIDNVFVNEDWVGAVSSYTFTNVTIPGFIYATFEADQPPVLTVPPDITIDCDDSCDPSNTGQATATDDHDSDPEVTYVDSKWYTGDISCIERLWSATDDKGQTTSGLQTIWMTAPGATVTSAHPIWVTSLPSSVQVDFIIEKYADSASIWSRCNENWSLHFCSDLAPVASDGSTVNTQFIDLPADAPEGTYQLMWIHMRPPANPCMSGFAKSFNWLLYGIDLSPPVITRCPRDITVVAPLGETSVEVDWEEPTAEDLTSSIQSFTSTHHPGDTFEVGTTEVIYTATDEAGHVATCSFDVAVGTIEEFVLRVPILLDPEDAPLIGDHPCAAICGAGELLGGSLILQKPNGQLMRGTAVILYLYAVELIDGGAHQTLIDHWSVGYDVDTDAWSFEIPTGDLEPGSYYIQLVFPGEATLTLPVEITSR